MPFPFSLPRRWRFADAGFFLIRTQEPVTRGLASALILVFPLPAAAQDLDALFRAGMAAVEEVLAGDVPDEVKPSSPFRKK